MDYQRRLAADHYYNRFNLLHKKVRVCNLNLTKRMYQGLVTLKTSR